MGSVDVIIDYFFLLLLFSCIKNTTRTPLPHLFAAKVKVEVLEISEAFVGEARAAQHGGDVGQGGEVVAQRMAPRLQAQLAVAVTSGEVLQVKLIHHRGNERLRSKHLLQC